MRTTICLHHPVTGVTATIRRIERPFPPTRRRFEPMYAVHFIPTHNAPQYRGVSPRSAVKAALRDGARIVGRA